MGPCLSILRTFWANTSARRKSVAGWVVALWLAVTLMGAAGLLRGADRLLADSVGSLFEASHARDDFVIVAIDAPSFQDVGEQWPWSRDIHAELVRQLHSLGARAIVFDIVFEQSTDSDAHFADAMRTAGNVYLAAERATTRTPQGQIETLALPTGRLLEEAKGVGIAGVDLDPDGRLRRLPNSADSIAYIVAADLAGETSSPASGKNKRYIRFARGQHRLSKVSYYQALSATDMLPPGTFTDKIVLIGLALEASPSASKATSDGINVPYYASAHGLMHGVEAQGNIAATTIAGDALRPAPAWIVVSLWIVAMCTSLWIAIWARTDIVRASLVLVSGALVLLLACGVARAGNAVVADSAPLLGLILIGSGFVSRSGLIAFQERRRIADGFGRYVSPDVLQRLLDDPSMLSLGGAMRDVSVVVTDLQGYTTLMESVDPEKGADVIREYLDELGQVVLRHGGMIDQFVGDSIIALFNAPTWQADHAMRALDCARDLVEAGRQMSIRFQANGIMLGVTRAGADCGQAMVGNFGTQRRFHYTAMGDVTNIASRLEAANKTLGTSLLATAGLFEAAGKPDGFLPAGRLLLPGRDEPVTTVTLSTSLSESELNQCTSLFGELLGPDPDKVATIETMLSDAQAGSAYFQALDRLAGLARGDVVETRK
ncbi:adenylate/guanylate cyclase with Chase sensor [Hyphomonas johnsonii MHS-2]|uniref:Adenylate/guanylate cyclase with Chase sensor n=1 Tax=Hyphomonas johnsonii MHS-2 TaxID=1280950 RepID=A0A059FSD4_9PROT|nr:adenylate/guanylate cyclase with Chase sensor [Hyphomonas johnsonii MHS-2]